MPNRKESKGAPKAGSGVVDTQKKQKNNNKAQPAKQLTKQNSATKEILVKDELSLRPLLANITKHPAVFSYDSR